MYLESQGNGYIRIPDEGTIPRAHGFDLTSNQGEKAASAWQLASRPLGPTILQLRQIVEKALALPPGVPKPTGIARGCCGVTCSVNGLVT